MKELSVVIPAYNEERGIAEVLDNLIRVLGDAGFNYEIIVVNDGSGDKTGEIVRKFPVTLMENTHNSGYGFSIIRGFEAAKYGYVAIIDADGSYPADALPELAAKMDEGYDMVVGARRGRHYWSSPLKALARFCFKTLSEFAAGKKIKDINSGLRIMRKTRVAPYIYETCRTFSFTTSLTLILMLNNLYVTYLPIKYFSRRGHSKVKMFRDTLRTAQIITEIVAKYNPLKLYILLTLFVLALSAVNFIFYAIWRAGGFWTSAFLGVFSAAVILGIGFFATIFRGRR